MYRKVNSIVVTQTSTYWEKALLSETPNLLNFAEEMNI